jgi:Right handed beta helix region
MAYPVILVDSGSGSDSSTSGAGPGTALTGTTASTDAGGTTVTLDAGTVLTSVDTTGLHAIYLNDTTAGHRRWARITGTSGSGGATPTVTVSEAFTGLLAAKSWAIGGKRASILGSTSLLLLDNNGSAGDAKGGWVIEFQSGHAESTGSGFTMRGSGDTTNGPLIVRGVSGAASRPTFTITSDPGTGGYFTIRGDYQVFRDFDIKLSMASNTSTQAIGHGSAGSYGALVDGMRIYSANTKTFAYGISMGSNGYNNAFRNCHIANCAVGINVSGGGGATTIVGCYIHDTTSHGIVAPDDGAWIRSCVFANIGGKAIDASGWTASAYRPLIIDGCSFYNVTGDAIDLSGMAGNGQSTILGRVRSCVFATIGAYALDLGSYTLPQIQAWGWAAENCAFYSTTSGQIQAGLTSLLTNCVTLSASPFTNPGSADFSLNATAGGGAACKAVGYPTAWLGLTTPNYLDIGAIQAQAAAAGGGLLVHPGMAGGMRG